MKSTFSALHWAFLNNKIKTKWNYHKVPGYTAQSKSKVSSHKAVTFTGWVCTGSQCAISKTRDVFYEESSSNLLPPHVRSKRFCCTTLDSSRFASWLINIESQNYHLMFLVLPARSVTLDVCVCETASQILPSVLMTNVSVSQRVTVRLSSSMPGQLPSSVWNSGSLITWGSTPQNWASLILKTRLLLESPCLLFILSFIESINVSWLLAMCQAYRTYNREWDRHGHHPPKALSLIGCQSLVVRREIQSQVLLRTDSQLLRGLWQTIPLCHSELCLLRSWVFWPTENHRILELESSLRNNSPISHGETGPKKGPPCLLTHDPPEACLPAPNTTPTTTP